MAIEGRTPKECFDTFRDHLAGVLSDTLSRDAHLTYITKRADLALVSFREGRPVACPVDSDYGRLFVYFGQEVEAVEEDTHRYRLETLKYWYRIQETADRSAQAILRWEYEPPEPDLDYCPRHVQIEGEVGLGDATADLDKLHLPTGRVLIEHVLRFLIADLGVTPPCGDEWRTVLADSVATYHDELSNR